VVSESSNFGDILHSLLGYADHPTLLQAFVWIAYVTVSVVFFMRIGRGGPRRDIKSNTSRAALSRNGSTTPAAGEV
jgi:high-affinity Fe2+/Pb2+ permease